MGATALQTLIDPEAPTYHPAALLREPAKKKDAWHDFKLVIDKYRELVDPAHVCVNHPAS
jgi:DNA polymerase